MKPGCVGWLVITAASLLLVGCAHRDNKDYAAMNKVPMHTVCLGRMLVDLPKGGKTDWQQQLDLAMVSKLPLSVITEAGFLDFVKNRMDDLKQPNYGNPKGRLGPVDRISESATILQFRPESGYDAGYETEGYVWLGYSGYEFKVSGVFNNEAAEVARRVRESFPALHAVTNYRPPDSPGFCIDGAMVTGKIGPIWSAATATIAGWKGVVADVSARENDGARPKPSWERNAHAPEVRTEFQELDGIKEWAAASARSGNKDRVVSFEVLRRRERSLAGMDGQEIAVKAKLADGQEWYRFEWNSLDDIKRPNKSGFSATLEAGDQQYTYNYAAPPSQEDLLALWDAMLDSLKPRPGSGR